MKEFKGPKRQLGFIGSLIEGIFAKKAASKQARANNKAIETIQGATQPFRDAGEAALGPP